MWRLRGIQSVLILSIALILGGCATGEIDIDNMNIPLSDIQKVVHDNLPVRTARVSTNGREFFSEYFTQKDGDYEKAQSSRVRERAHVTILGDEWPYTITIRVRVEARDNSGDYSVIRYDKGLARVLSRRIQMALHKRREGRNIIDDFRPY